MTNEHLHNNGMFNLTISFIHHHLLFGLVFFSSSSLALYYLNLTHSLFLSVSFFVVSLSLDVFIIE
jgi:hypothetical protein